ncbi:hypothetical protein G7Z17_g2395 [Cylindrodendrum hubeiense]|uniref:Uncharacterized protein n=1 Tax=Cylindrodendrum hubeiense TaxID=595255 RepID=A0A9P5LEJ4_9HYPO|nr:hypothetical protein G7Z17_g2395 [Cylindrodendrum hubeiense]
MPSIQQTPWSSIDEIVASLRLRPRLPDRYRAKLGRRASRDASRFYACLNIWPWDLVPQYSYDTYWGVSILENLAILARYVSQDAKLTVTDLRKQLIMSMIIRSGEGEVKLQCQDARNVRAEFLDKSDDRDGGGDNWNEGVEDKDEDNDEDEDEEPISTPASSNQPSDPSSSSSVSRCGLPQRIPSYPISTLQQTPPQSPSDCITAACSPPLVTVSGKPRSKSPLKRPRPSPTIGSSPPAKRPRLSESSKPIKSSLSLLARASLSQRSPGIGPGGLPSIALVYSQMLVNAAEPNESTPKPGSIHESLLPAITNFITQLDCLIDYVSCALETADAELESKLIECQEITNRERFSEENIDRATQALRSAQRHHSTLVAEADEFEKTAISLRGMGNNSQSPCLPQLQTAIDAYGSQIRTKREEAAAQEAIVHSCATDVDEAKTLAKGSADIVAKLNMEKLDLGQNLDNEKARWNVLANVKTMMLGLERTIPSLEDMASS